MPRPLAQINTHIHRRSITPLILSFAALASPSAIERSASAGLLLWNNVAGGAASTAGNWSPTQIPVAADDLTFNLAGNFAVTFNATVASSHSQTYRVGTVTVTNSSPHIVTNGFTIGDLSGDNAVFTLTTGTMTSNANVIVGDASGSIGTLNVNDDDADFIVASAADLIVGNIGDAAMNITGSGLVQVADQFIAGSNSTSSPVVTISGFQVTPINASRLQVLGSNESRIGQGGDATMTISNGALADFAGSVIVANGSASVSSVTVQTTGLLDARLTTAGDLLLGRNSSATAAGDGTLTVNNGGTVNVGGTFFVGSDPNGGAGHLNIGSGGDVLATNMQTGVNGTVTMAAGTLTCDNAIANNANGVIIGTGAINADINNAGSIIPNTPAGLVINGTLFNTTSNLIAGTAITFGNGGGYEGSGTCVAAINGQPGSLIKATGTLSIGNNTTAGFFSIGDLDVGGNIVTLLDSNGAVLGGLTTINSGRIECPVGIGLQNGGVMRGDGLFVGDVTCSGTLDPHLDNTFGGLFTIQGDLQMNPTGIVDFEIGGTPASNRNDLINISGTADFDGTMHVKLKNGYTPQRGQQYIVANAVGGRTGEFTNVISPDNVCNGVTFVLVYSSTAAIILIRPPDADTNDDGRIDVSDLITVITQWGVCGGGGGNPPCGTGNVDGVDDVGVSDLLIVITHWGVCPTPAP